MKLLSRILLSLFRPLVFLFDMSRNEKYKRYIIKRGKHRSCFKFKPVIIDEAMSFTVRFNYTAQYKTIDPINQWDINKLWGFSEYLFNNHRNSARVGWNWRDGQLYLRPYSYCNGKTQIDPPEIPIEIDKDIECLIIVLEDQYVFYLDKERVSMPRTKGPKSFVGVQLYPYFGGTETAPHTISVSIKS
jgi:hypothetical protein